MRPTAPSSPASQLVHFLLAVTTVGSIAWPAHGKTHEVGPTKRYATLAELSASKTVRDSDVIEVDSTGEYCGDVAIWKADNLTIRGVGPGRAHLRACGKSVQGKAIWVVRGEDFTAENIEFSGARVRHRNGAGIRLENPGQVTIRNCHFHDNENGILGGGPNSSVLVENSIFERNGHGDGRSHNAYIGKRVAKLVFRYNYTRGARVGHNLKSRARENYILYNRIMDEHEGNASFQVDLPQGGKSYLIGNVIQQGPRAENFAMLAYANEGKKAAHELQQLYVVNNTFVNTRSGRGRFISIRGVPETKTQAVLRNNVFWGAGEVWSSRGDVEVAADHNVKEPRLSYDLGFVDPGNFDYRLAHGSPAIDAGVTPGEGGGYDLVPRHHYLRDAQQTARNTVGQIDAGAFEYLGGPEPAGTSNAQIQKSTPFPRFNADTDRSGPRKREAGLTKPVAIGVVSQGKGGAQ